MLIEPEFKSYMTYLENLGFLYHRKCGDSQLEYLLQLLIFIRGKGKIEYLEHWIGQSNSNLELPNLYSGLIHLLVHFMNVNDFKRVVQKMNEEDLETILEDLASEMEPDSYYSDQIRKIEENKEKPFHESIEIANAKLFLVLLDIKFDGFDINARSEDKFYDAK